MIASLVRFHRGKDPRSVYPPFAALSAAEQESVVVLVGLLRLAHAVARGPEGERLEVGVASRRGALRVLISGSENPDAVIVEARLADLLARTLESRIEIGTGDVGPRQGGGAPVWRRYRSSGDSQLARWPMPSNPTRP